MNSKYYIYGFLCGIIVVVLFVIIRALLQKHKGGACCPQQYDERQQAIQGRGYKYAYSTLLGVTILGGVLEVLTDAHYFTLFTFAITALWISLSIFMSYCVLKDAYFSLKSRRKPLIVFFLLAAIINLAFAANGIFSNGGLISNHQLNFYYVNLITGLSLLLNCGVMIAKEIIERREEEVE